MKINKYLQLCFQNTTIKMIIFCACKNLLNNKRSLKEYRNHCAKRPWKIYIYGYTLCLNLIIEHSGEHWREQNIFCLFITPQVFWQSSAPGALSTLVTSVVLYSLTQDTLMSPGKDETCVCGYMLWIYSLSTLENTDENRILFVHSPHQKHFGKTQHLVLWAFWWHQLFSTC